MYESYASEHIHYYTDEVPAFVDDVLSKNRISSLIDLGAGDGALLRGLLKKSHLDGVREVTAVDISQRRIDNVARISERIRCIVGDVENLSVIASGTQDFVIAKQVIEHVPDETAFIREISRIVESRGFVYLSTVFKKKYAWYFYRSKGRWVLDPTHLREYSQDEELLRLLRLSGLDVLAQKKTLFRFPLTDFIIKRMGGSRKVYQNRFLNFLRVLKVPIFGYFEWELLLQKKRS